LICRPEHPRKSLDLQLINHLLFARTAADQVPGKKAPWKTASSPVAAFCSGRRRFMALQTHRAKAEPAGYSFFMATNWKSPSYNQ
jgi:hypothetical protein